MTKGGQECQRLVKKPNSRSQGGTRTVPHIAFMGDVQLKVSSEMTRDEQNAKIKAQVLDYIKNNLDRDEQGNPILYMDNNPVIYDPNGQWTLDEQTVTQTEAGQVQTTTALGREMGGTPCYPRTCSCPNAYAKRRCRTRKATVWPRSYLHC